jgi:ABC-type Fe3+/spermidine/putrescine transport system ATPase subunit
VLETIGLGWSCEPARVRAVGRQQQRVVLGRALVSDPTLLLLDEPFSNLDARLRDGMRVELSEILSRVGLTTIFATHDPTEAMMLSDHSFVTNGGHVEQVGTPREVYERPAARFVMAFLGRITYLRAHIARLADGRLGARLVGRIYPLQCPKRCP